MSKLFFATRAYESMSQELCLLTGGTPAELERQTFPDGEQYVRIATPVRGQHVVLVGGTVTDADTLEIYDVASAIVKGGACSLTLAIPYFGYATMERATKAGEVVRAKSRARLLSSIPAADRPNHVIIVDAHTEGLPYYFEGSVVTVHAYAKSVVSGLIRDLGGDDFVLACTDAGRAKWVESLANDLHITPSFVFKRRIDGATTSVTAVSAAVEGKKVIIYDDMIRTGSSLLGAARAYLAAGAKSVAAVTTHGVLPGDSLARIEASGLLSAIASTDTHPRARELAGKFLRVESVGAAIAIHLGGH
jgi:ribose-phosphate pyrophosphokinase